MGSKGGRSRKPGARYPSGHHRPPGQESGSPTEWARIRAEVAKAAKDTRLASEAGRLNFHGEITNAETATAFKIGEVYHRYHRLKQLRESAKSANFEGGMGSADLAEERMTFDQLEEHERAIRSAEEAWKKIDDRLADVPRALRQAVLDVCVYDQPTNPMLYPDLRWFLGEMSKRWTPGWKAKDSARSGRGATTRHGADIVEAMPSKPTVRRPDTALGPLRAVVHRLRPDLDQMGIDLVVDTFVALRARQEFRDKKVGKRQP
jgi:hypothetical protein